MTGYVWTKDPVAASEALRGSNHDEHTTRLPRVLGDLHMVAFYACLTSLVAALTTSEEILLGAQHGT
jgi:hypothetical protein